MRITDALLKGGLALAALGLSACAPGFVRVKDALGAADAPGLAAAVRVEGFERAQAALEPSANAEFGARIQAKLQGALKAAGAQALRVDYDSGKGSWGASVLIRLEGPPPPGTGARLLELEAWAPAGSSFSVALHESGRDGGDGEVWVSPDLSGKGRWKSYGIPVQRLYRSGWSGSQNGAGRLDAGAINAIELLVAARQGSGSILLDEVRLR